MKFYKLESTLNFGKYNGKTIKESLDIQVNYIDWCIIHLDHFYVSEDDLVEMKKYKTDFKLSQEAIEELENKYNEWLKTQHYSTYDDDDSEYEYSSRDAERDDFDALTDGQYGDYDDWGGDWDGLRDSMGY